MVQCEFCGKEIDLYYVCKYCGGVFCVEHRVPESHNCPLRPHEPPPYFGMPPWPPSIEPKQTVQKPKVKKLRRFPSEKGEREKPVEKQPPPIEPKYVGFSKEPVSPPKRKKGVSRGKLALVTFLIGIVTFGVAYEYFNNWALPFSFQLPDWSIKIDQVEKEVFKLINEERVKRGLPKLSFDEKLAAAAKEWSEHLVAIGDVEKIEHGDFELRMSKIGYLYIYRCGEIIAAYEGLPYADEFVEMWLESPKHKAIMLFNATGYTGVGVSYGTYSVAVVDFAFK